MSTHLSNPLKHRVCQGIALFVLAVSILLIAATPVAAQGDGGLTGLVTDGEGRPLAGVEVVVRQQTADGRGGQHWAEIATVATDASGQYSLSAPPSGAYQLDVRATANLGEVAEIVLHSNSAVAASGASARTGSIRGQVLDSKGRGVKQIAVSLYRAFTDPFGHTSWTLARRVLTGGNGGYQLRDVPAGTYRLGFADALFPERYLAEYFNDVQDFELAATLDVTPGAALRHVDARLTPAGLIAGRVTDEAGNAASAVTTMLFRRLDLPEGDYWTQASSTFTLEDGSYQYTALSPGYYRIQFMDFTGFLRYLPEFYDDAASLETATDLPLAAGDQMTNIDASLAAPGSISGVVTNEEGAPLVNIWVNLYQEANGVWAPGAGGVITDLTGRFMLNGLSPGVYRIGFADLFMPPRYQGEFFNNASTVEAATDIVVDKGSAITGIDAHLTAHGRIRGLVTDEVGNPLSSVVVDALVFVTDPILGDVWQLYTSAWTDEDGRYELLGLTPGAYRLSFHDGATPPRFHPEFYLDAPSVEAGADVMIAGDETIEGIDASLASTGHITGRVTNTQGEPLAFVTVTAYRYTQDDMGNLFWVWYTFASSDIDGQFDLANLEAGTYRLSFEHWIGLYQSEWYDNALELESATDVQVGISAQVSGINVQLASVTAIRGVVTGEDGAPLANVAVTAYAVEQNEGGLWVWTPRQSVVTDELGGYQLTDLQPQNYRIGFSDLLNPKRYQREYYFDALTVEEATDVTLLEGEVREGVSVQLALAGRITGRVTDESGAPLPNITVTDLIRMPVLPSGESWDPQTSAMTDANGMYELAGIQAGVHRIYFVDDSGLFANEYYNDAVAFENATSIPVSVGETIGGVDAQLALATPTNAAPGPANMNHQVLLPLVSQ
jgi:protocatechuate 3,4-dioxygenase beta subunit